MADDEEFCISSMHVLLKKTGFDTEKMLDVCINGEELVKIVKVGFETGINYKVIFTDFSMPGVDGIEATRQIRLFFDEQGVPRDKQPLIFGVTGHV